MPTIHSRAIAGAAAALLITLTAASVEASQTTSNAPQDRPAMQPPPTAAVNDDAEPVLAEPNFRILNLPSTLRLPARGSSFELTHRFNGNLRRGSFSQDASSLFGLDQGAVVGFEYRFGIVRRVQAVFYRTAIDKTIQLSGKYDAVQQGGPMPVAVSALASIEGADNFQERYSPALGVVVSRMVADRLAVYATPVWVHNTAALLDSDRDTSFVGIGGRLRLSSTVYVVAEIAPRAGGYRPDDAAFGFAIEKRAGGHMFQLNFGNGQGTTFGQLARGGFADSLYLGFNLSRKFF